MHFIKKKIKQKREDFIKKLKKGNLNKLNIEVSRKYLKKNNKKGIF